MQTGSKKKVDSGLTPTCLAGWVDATSLRSEKRARAGGGAGAGAGRTLAGQDEGELWGPRSRPLRPLFCSESSVSVHDAVPQCVCARDEYHVEF